jgi:hypothetical protein
VRGKQLRSRHGRRQHAVSLSRPLASQEVDSANPSRRIFKGVLIPEQPAPSPLPTTATVAGGGFAAEPRVDELMNVRVGLSKLGEVIQKSLT